MAQSASLRRGLSALALASVTGIALLLGGCDSPTGTKDKEVTKMLDGAASDMSDSDGATSNKELADAVRETTASDSVQLRAKALLADSELNLAQMKVAQIQSNDAQIDRFAREIGLLCDGIAANNQAVAALAKYEPTDLQSAVKKNQSDITGTGADSAWVKTDSASLAAMSVNKAQIGQLSLQITKLQAEIKTKTDQRNQLLDQADRLTVQSQHETRDKSLQLYKQGSDTRKQAADLTIGIDTASADLAAKQADLAVVQGQIDAATAAIQSLGDKWQSFADEWQAAQKQQMDLMADSKASLGDDPVNKPTADKHGEIKTDPTIGSKAAAIEKLAEDNRKLRSDAEAAFNSAIDQYGDALNTANSIKADLGTLAGKVDPQRPEQEAWKQELDAIEPSTYKSLQANAMLQEAEFFAASAGEAKTRLDLMERVKPTLDDAKLAIFPELTDSNNTISVQMTKAQASAAEDFKKATDVLSAIYDGMAQPGIKAGAKAQEIFGEYGWYTLLKTFGDVKKDAMVHLSAARAAVAAATADGIALPTLPPELVTAAPAVPGAGVPVPGGPGGRPPLGGPPR